MKWLAKVALAAWVWLGIVGAAWAGLGPENVLLVVNRSSWASQTVANHYVALRHLPITNVVYLDWTGSLESIDVETFRQKILGPVLATIDQRGLADQIDAIIYSSDFPFAIELTGDLGKQKPPAQLSPVASITAATYLWQFTMSKNPNVIGLQNNQYVRDAEKRKVATPTQGFRSWYGWNGEGQSLEAGGVRYMLSTMLAVTSGRGNSVPEAVGYLRRSAKADGVRYPGTVYYSVTSDVRSTTRAGVFETAIDALVALGVKADVVSAALPTGKNDVAGLMIGAREFSWPSSRSTILPGAICENLTSFGGAMGETSGQTPLSEFLRYGAAGSSGTVVEPYAIQSKFPLPSIQVHYARGCSLAEAFYQSLSGPYQLLIVGDPLCQPWARIPQVQVEGVPQDDKVTGTLALKPSAKVDGGKVDRFELFIDGIRAQRRPSGVSFSLDSTQLSNGYHDLRVVAIDASPIETQGRAILPITVVNEAPVVELAASGKVVEWGKKVTLTLKSPGLERGAVFFNGRPIGKTEKDGGQIEVDSKDLGTGPITFLGLGISAGGRTTQAAVPASITVKAKPLAALPPLTGKQLARGMQLRVGSRPPVPVQETVAPDWLKVAGVKSDEAFTVEGYFNVPPAAKETVAASAPDVAAESVWQFQTRYKGQLKLTVDQSVLHDGKDGDGSWHYLPIALAPGLHRLSISSKLGGELLLQVRYGGEGTRSIDGATFRHPE